MTDLSDKQDVAASREALMRAYQNLEALTHIGPDDMVQEAAEKLGIVENLYELEVKGYTIVPPEKVGSARFRSDLRDAVLRTYERRSKDPRYSPRLKMGEDSGIGAFMAKALFDDPMFETALMNPVAQTLARSMCGATCRLSLFHAVVKRRSGGGSIGFHCDTELTEPYPSVPQFCNVTYALTDYSADNGATLFVPGSHRLLRQPHTVEVEGSFHTTGAVAGSTHMPEAIPVECEAGSIIAWSGLMWHGAAPRVSDGERINILMYFSRWYLQTQENYRDHVPQEVLERNNPRFAQLMDVVPGWAVKDPHYSDDMATALTGRTVYPILDTPLP